MIKATTRPHSSIEFQVCPSLNSNRMTSKVAFKAAKRAALRIRSI